MVVIRKVITLLLSLTLLLFFVPVALAGESPVLTLEQARALAQAQGLWQQELELGYSRTEIMLLQQKKNLGIGVMDSKYLKESVEHLDTVIAEMKEEADQLKEQIASWEEEVEVLRAEDPVPQEVYFLERNIEEAKIELLDKREEINYVGRNRSALEVRMYATRELEDQVEQILNPLEDAHDAASDALLQQPRIIDYQVENLYLSLLELEAGKKSMEASAELLQKLVEVEKLKRELGMGTPQSQREAEQNLKQLEERLKDLKNTEMELKRSLNRLMGIPLEHDFAVTAVSYELPYGGLPLDTEPDLQRSVSYRRAVENLERKKSDFDDLTYYDRESETDKYRLIKAELETAEVELEKTILSLQANYQKRKEQLLLAAEAVEVAASNLENAKEKLRQERIKHNLGMISPLELKQQELALLEAEAGYLAAQNRHFLAFRAYMLARDGIEIAN